MATQDESGASAPSLWPFRSEIFSQRFAMSRLERCVSSMASDDGRKPPSSELPDTAFARIIAPLIH